MAASLELAISAIRAGRKAEGRQLLNLLIQQNPNNEQAWLWMSSVVDTDEQRARCLYHVLAVNPTNELARKGLDILGIVVTDSRPVKIPRDSQPIQIPTPSPAAGPGFPHEAAPAPQPPTPVDERRPFRLDPQAIANELPFTPINRPAAATQTEPPPGHASKPVPAAPIAPPPQPQPPAAAPNGYAGQPPQPYYPAAYYPPTGQETRPTQPLPVLNAGLTLPPSMAQQQHPPEPGYGGHSNVTMGMPTQYFPPQPQTPQFHAGATMPMPGYPQPQMPVMAGQNMAFHSNATMAMPMGYDPFAAQQDYRLAQATHPNARKRRIQEDDEEDEDGVNILAVIIFGSLSVTALGGLGILILLMFTGG